MKSHILVTNHQLICLARVGEYYIDEGLVHKLAKKVNSKHFPNKDIPLNQ